MNLPARPIRRTAALVAMLSASASLSPAAAQVAAPARPQQTAVRIDGPAPTVDGRLDEAVWSAAPALTRFTQTDPREGAPASDRTEVRFAFDGEALYVGARMHADDPATVRASLGRRDQGGDAERLLVSLDPYLDRRTAYTFGVTAAGARLDFHSPTDVAHPRDASFDPVWQAAARVDSLGWTAEMRIPFSQLRFTDRPDQTWGLNVNRWVPWRNEDAFWIAVPSRETGWASRFGDLVGISGIRPSRRVEVMPYVASDARLVGEVDADDPFARRHSLGARVGADVRMGLGPSLTLEATVNPDFGQVEADPAEVNLTAFESFFDERRPFFTEANRAIAGGGPSYFYSRRVGARPRVPVDADYADYPGASTILGAAKLSGRLRSGTSVGALAAVTGREEARVFDEDGERFGRVAVAPPTLFTAGRVQQEFGRDASTVGLTLTGVARDPDALMAGYLNRAAVSGGTDWNLRFRGGEYVVSGFAGFSWVEGDTAAIRRVQRSSAHYFHRPDATHVTFDPTRTSLGGYTAGLEVERAAGDHWLWGVAAAAESPGLELNDAGRIGRADQVTANAAVRYRETQPGRLFRSWSVRLGSENEWDFAGTRGSGAVRSDASFTWRNFWQTSLTGWVDLRAQSPTLTRGGPYAGTGRAWSLAGSLSNSFGASTRWEAEGRVGGDELGGHVFEVEGELSVRPGPRWQLSLEPGYTRVTDPRQYVATLEGGPAATFGSRYVFATVERSEVAAEMRLAYTFTPDLSLEVFAQPFVSTGRYGGFGQLAAPRSRALERFGADGPVRSDGGVHSAGEGADARTVAEDFHVRSFRSNAVMRWEWRPGSTLFLVWQQARASDRVDGRFVRPGDLWRTLDATGDNYLALKATYWLPLR